MAECKTDIHLVNTQSPIWIRGKHTPSSALPLQKIEPSNPRVQHIVKISNWKLITRQKHTIPPNRDGSPRVTQYAQSTFVVGAYITLGKYPYINNKERHKILNTIFVRSFIPFKYPIHHYHYMFMNRNSWKY